MTNSVTVPLGDCAPCCGAPDPDPDTDCTMVHAYVNLPNLLACAGCVTLPVPYLAELWVLGQVSQCHYAAVASDMLGHLWECDCTWDGAKWVLEIIDPCGNVVWTGVQASPPAAPTPPGTMGGLIYNRTGGCSATPATLTVQI